MTKIPPVPMDHNKQLPELESAQIILKFKKKQRFKIKIDCPFFLDWLKMKLEMEYEKEEDLNKDQ